MYDWIEQKAEKIWYAYGLECAIVQHSSILSIHYSGYVRVPADHPYRQNHLLDGVEDTKGVCKFNPAFSDIPVGANGKISFADPDTGWVGFSTSSYSDCWVDIRKGESLLDYRNVRSIAVVWTLDLVEYETEHLAFQIAQAYH